MMNNKKGMLSLTTLFILMFVAVILAMAQNGVDKETIDSNITNVLNWSKMGANISNSLQASAEHSTNDLVKVVFMAMDKAIDFFGYTTFEVTKLAGKYASSNPEIINANLLLNLIILCLLAPLIYPVFMIIVSLILIIKEWIVSRREKKKLNQLRKVSF